MKKPEIRCVPVVCGTPGWASRLLHPHSGYDLCTQLRGCHMYYGIGLGGLVVIVVVLLLLF